MDSLTPADALRLAINALRDIAEFRKMPSGIGLDEATAGMHADAAETLTTLLGDLQGYE